MQELFVDPFASQKPFFKKESFTKETYMVAKDGEAGLPESL